MVESGSEEWTEWTYEGRRKVSHRVATDGISACYKGSAYQSCTCEEKRMIISSGGIAKAALLSRSLDEGAFYFVRVGEGEPEKEASVFRKTDVWPAL